MSLTFETAKKWYSVGYMLKNLPQPDWDNLATDEQKRMFFALAAEQKFDLEEVKERAKEHFRVLSFSHLSRDQLSQLIEKLQRRKNEEA